MHECIQQKTIAEIGTKVELLAKEVLGNGREGLMTIVPRIETTLGTLAKTLDAQTKQLTLLSDKVLEMKTTNVVEEKGNNKAWNRSGILISAILGVSAIVVTILLKT